MTPSSSLSSLSVLFLWGAAFHSAVFAQSPATQAAPLAKNAVTSDWPRLLGPSHNLHSPETPLLQPLPPEGPKLLWQRPTGEGYGSVAAAGGRALVFFAKDGQEVLECLDAESGKLLWTQSYPIEYRDRYGFASGPRTSPAIAEGVVVTLGVTSQLQACAIHDGRLLWRLDLRRDHQVPQDFFGAGSTPLLHEGKVIVQVGGKEVLLDGEEDRRRRAQVLASKGTSVAAFDLKTGTLRWKLVDAWGAGYASPVLASLHGKPKILIYAGGESDPASGGLLCIDPTSGQLHSRHAWRDPEYIQAIGSSPVVVGNRVFISTAYPKNKPIGGLMLEFDAEFKATEVWSSKTLGCHWMTPLAIGNHLYAIDGERENQARLVCVRAEDGKEIWSERLRWQDASLGQRMGRAGPVELSIFRANLIKLPQGVLCLGEIGSLHWLDLQPEGMKELSRSQLFYATNTWCVPAVHRGLLLVQQHERSLIGGEAQRVLCYDLRGRAD